MDRRVFLKVTGLVAIATAFDALPVAAAEPARVMPAGTVRDLMPATRPLVSRVRITEPGTYRISGTVRPDAALVEISGIANSQQVSWSGPEGTVPPLASFTSFEQFDGPGLTPEIQIRGGRLESLSV